MLRPKPFVLIILDGFGTRAATSDNAISAAATPNFKQLYKSYAHTLISGSGHDVGLPKGQMGNSEVGHINLGSGRVVYQELTRIDNEIETGNFYQNPVLLKAIEAVKNNHSTLHILGLLSPGGVHSFEEHFVALIELAHRQGLHQVMLHAFLDGRDTPPKSAKNSLERFDLLLRSQNIGQVASIVGRYYAMDRDKRWERTEQAYELLTQGKAVRTADNALAALELAYQNNETDEFVKPTLIKGAKTIADGDAVIFMNFRADRARQLTHAFVDDNFSHFNRGPKLKLADFVTLTEYEKGLSAQVAYPPQSLHNVLGEYLSELGLKQLRIAETEKYAHVTFFFNGGREDPFPGEERILVPSPKVATYDLQPEMSAYELTEQLVTAILSKKFDLIVCNYANADMVGHTGNFEATVKAIDTLDTCIGRVVSALKEVGGEALITADHGNAEKMRDETTGQAHTAHTSDPVPLIYVGRAAKVVYNDGILSDIAPTLLNLMGLPVPKEMTGRILLKLKDA